MDIMCIYYICTSFFCGPIDDTHLYTYILLYSIHRGLAPSFFVPENTMQTRFSCKPIFGYLYERYIIDYTIIGAYTSNCLSKYTNSHHQLPPCLIIIKKKSIKNNRPTTDRYGRSSDRTVYYCYFIYKQR